MVFLVIRKYEGEHGMRTQLAPTNPGGHPLFTCTAGLVRVDHDTQETVLSEPAITVVQRV